LAEGTTAGAYGGFGWKADIETNPLFRHARGENGDPSLIGGIALYAAVAAAAFNLSCTGLLETESVEKGKKVEPFSTTFRIDLASKKWCEGACTLTFDVVRFDDVSVTLKLDSTGPELPHSYNRMSYIRGTPTGHYSEYRMSFPDREHVYFFQREARCTEGPFDGFDKPAAL
jgi:hypothetical protein